MLGPRRQEAEHVVYAGFWGYLVADAHTVYDHCTPTATSSRVNCRAHYLELGIRRTRVARSSSSVNTPRRRRRSTSSVKSTSSNAKQRKPAFSASTHTSRCAENARGRSLLVCRAGAGGIAVSSNLVPGWARRFRRSLVLRRTERPNDSFSMDVTRIVCCRTMRPHATFFQGGRMETGTSRAVGSATSSRAKREAGVRRR